MSTEQKKKSPLHEDLDTAYVNLGALLRYLRQREFSGRVHVELDEYEVDVFLHAKDAPRVREVNHASGQVDESEAALHRLLVRAQEAGGLISVYEGEDEEVGQQPNQSAIAAETARLAAEQQAAVRLSEDEAERRELLLLSGELIAAIERAASVAGGDFAAAFHQARISLADDYPFLDPMQQRFTYTGGVVKLQGKASTGLYVSGVSEALRRAVERIVNDGEKIGMRRDVARELSTLKRRRMTALSHFKFTPHLERIAGMRLL